MKKEITIYDIAREAGVSPATVSRVITKNARVSDARRIKVEQIILKHKFQPNAMARSLSETDSKTIGLMVADIRNPYYASVAVECEIAAYHRGYSVFLCNALNEHALEDSLLEKLYSQRVDAIIQVGCRVDDLKSDRAYVEHVNRIAQSIPFIITGHLEGGDCYEMRIDHAEGMRIILSYLHSLGHRDIAMLGGNLNVKSTYDMWTQYLYLMGNAGIKIHENYLQTGSFDDKSGYEGIVRLLRLKKPPTAVIAINDYSAVGALRALTEHGLSVPEDISLISYDNTFLAEISNPMLTSVDYNYPKMAEELVSLAIRLIRREEVPRQKLLTPTLIARDSCAAPRQGALHTK